MALADRETGELLRGYYCRPDLWADCAVDLWEETLQKYGVPETLYICRAKSAAMLEDYAQRLGGHLKRVKRLPAARRALRDFGCL